MATLTNTQISVTYVGLLKTSANTILTSTAQQITDGSGNNSILFLSTAGVGIGGAAASGKELDVTGNVLVTGDLQVDNLNIDGNTISSTAGTDLNITPLAGQQIVLDGTIVIDAGVVTGATSITSTSFVGELTGNASTSTKIASITNSNIVQLTSSQTLTNKTIDVDNNTVSNIEVDNFKASAIVIESEGIGSNDNDTTLPTSAAVKDYVDTQVTAQDLDFAGGSGTGSVDLDSQTFTIAGTTNEIETSASGQTLTVGLPSTVAITTKITSPIFGLGDGTSNKIQFIGGQGNWRVNISDSANQFVIHSESLASDYFTVIGGGGIKLNAYGSGNKTGTVAKNLAVDSSGNIIETDGGVVDGSGTANDVVMWSDANTLTDAPIAISGNNATFAGQVEVALASNQIKLSTGTAGDGYLNIGHFANGSFIGTYGDDGGAADLLRFGVHSGDVALTIDSSQNATFAGRVGIGATSFTFSDLLTIKSPSSNTTTGIASPQGINLNNTNTTDGNYTTIQNRDGNGDQNAEIKFFNISHTNNQGAIAFTTRSGTDVGERMRLDSSGNLGILTTTMLNTGSGRGSLTIGGNVSQTLNLGDGSINLGLFSTSSTGVIYSKSDLVFQTGSSFTTALTIDSSQNSTFAGEISATDDINTTGKLFVNKTDAELRLKSTSSTGTSVINFADPDDNDVGQIEYSHNDNEFQFKSNDSTALTIDASQNVGIGTSTIPSYWSGYSAIQVGADNSIFSNTATNTGSAIFIGQNLYNDGSNYKYTGASSNEGSLIDMRNGIISFLNAPAGTGTATVTERMRITSGGDIQIPTDSAKIQLRSSGSADYTSINRDSSNTLVVRNTAGNSIFALENGGNLVIGGTLTQGSDISYKENIKPLESQLEIVNKLNPVSYNRIGQKENEIGFIAQEVEKLIPDLVSENPDGLKSLAYGNMTSILVKSIQEQQDMIQELKKEIEILKNK